MGQARPLSGMNLAQQLLTERQDPGGVDNMLSPFSQLFFPSQKIKCKDTLSLPAGDTWALMPMHHPMDEVPP